MFGFCLVLVLPVDIAGVNYIDQRFPNSSEHHDHKWLSPIPEFLIPQVQGEAQEWAFLTSSHVMLMLSIGDHILRTTGMENIEMKLE